MLNLKIESQIIIKSFKVATIYLIREYLIILIYNPNSI